MAYTAQNLEHAVSIFYSSEHNDRAEAHKWLTEAQRCPEAWIFVWELLNSQKSTEIQFFAATTLHTKLQRCWSEVPPNNYNELKNRIMQAITNSFHGPKIVLNRLCISLAAFILQQRGQGLLETVNELSCTQNVSLLIEVLSVIPEEFNNMTMPANDRSIVRNNLQQLTKQILELVLKYLQNNVHSDNSSDAEWSYQVNIWQGACLCAGAWIQLGGVTPLECVPIVTSALQVLHCIYRRRQSISGVKAELNQSELEACEAALNTAGSALTQPDAGRHPATCCRLLRLLIDAVEPILQVEDILHSANEDLVVALYSTLVAAGEFHARWIAISNSEEEIYSNEYGTTDSEQIQSSMKCAKDILRLLLCCSGAPGIYPIQESHSKLAFSFWFTLQDEGLWNTRGNSNIVKQGLRLWYEQLVVILLRKSTISSNHTEFSAEDDELVRCYRQDISDTLVYCHTVLGDSFVVQLENLMRNLMENCLSDGGCELEAVLHAFLALAEFIQFSASPSLMVLMRILIELPYDKLHQQVLLTALGCFISYADWLGNVDNPDVGNIIGRALNIIWIAMDNKDLTPLGVLALKALCKECNKYLQPHAHQLLQLFQTEQSKWPPLIASQIMRAAGCAAVSLAPSEAAPYLTNLVTPLVTKLQITKKKQLNSRQYTTCTHTLQQAASLLSSLLELDIKHAYVPLTLLLPIFGDIAQHSSLTEPLFKLIKVIITRLQDECIPLLPDLIRTTSISLDVNPHPSNIEVCKLMSMMLPEVGGDAFSAAVSAVLRVSGETVTLGQPLSAHAPLLDAFYSAIANILSKKPQILQCLDNQMENIIQLALLTMSLPEQGPLKSACTYFGNMAKVHPTKIFPHGSTLVHRTVHCIGISAPRQYIDSFADLLWKLSRSNWIESVETETNLSDNSFITSTPHFSTWLKDCLQEPNFPSNLATPQVKDKFIKAIIKNYGHKRRMTEAIKEFALSCRGLLNTYGEATQSSNIF